jgi:hypothetical protein
MKILYLDESGDHNLISIDRQYPVFVLGGVLIDSSSAREIHNRICDFKERLFGRGLVIQHTADISRNRGGFECLVDTHLRERFYKELNTLMESMEYSVVACAVRKCIYPPPDCASHDLYLICLEILLERLCEYVARTQTEAVIVAESRGPTLDKRLRSAWCSLRTHGTQHLSEERVQRSVHALILRPKEWNMAGLQLADLVVGPIGRFVLGRTSHEDFHLIMRKLLRMEDAACALVVLPKEEGQDPLRSSQP